MRIEGSRRTIILRLKYESANGPGNLIERRCIPVGVNPWKDPDRPRADGNIAYIGLGSKVCIERKRNLQIIQNTRNIVI